MAVHGGFLTKSHDNTRLDLGGIAKGWAVDAIIHNLQAHGYRHAYVDFGGDVRGRMQSRIVTKEVPQMPS